MATKKAQQHARFERSLQCSTATIKNAPSKSLRHLLERADSRLRLNRLGSALDRARNVMNDTEELWMEMAEAFPVEAHVVDPRRMVPAHWIWRGRDGRVQGIVIGGAGTQNA